MDMKAIIDTYVDDVVRHVPRRQRDDVGFELRSLLTEELEGRAADAGRPVDEAMTVEMLTQFGHPRDVADRYRPAGFTVIRPADAPRFARVALIGVALQWAITLPAALIGPAQVGVWAYGADAWWGRLSIWWLSWGLGSFWWPGVLITLSLLGAAFSNRRAEERRWTPRRAVDPDRISRPGTVAALAFWLIGATAMIALVSLADWAPGLPQPFLSAVALEPDFLAWRAPWVLPLWLAHFAVYATVLAAGRWTRGTRRIDLALGVGWLALIIWWLAAGPIFPAEGTDGLVKLILVLAALMVLFDSTAALRRTFGRRRLPVL